MSIQEALDLLIIFSEKYKGIYFKLNNEQNIYIKFDPYGIPHWLGLNRVKYFKNFGSSKNIFFYLKKKGLDLKKLNRRKISNFDLKVIDCKINAIINIVTFFKYVKNIEKFNIAEKGEFKTHQYDWIINIKESCIVLKEHSFRHEKKDLNFSSCCVLSIRHLNCFKKDNVVIDFNYDLKVLSYHFPLKHQLQFI